MPIQFTHKPGLVIYFTSGDPDLATMRDMAISAIDDGGDKDIGIMTREMNLSRVEAKG